MTEQTPRADPAAPTSARKGLAHYLGLSLSGALLVLVLALAALVIVIPKLAGGVPLTVLTSSMIPTLPPGTLIVDRPVSPNDLRVGDVATYQITSGRPGVITHRIIAIHNASNGTRSFQFKGDNNSQPDPTEILAAQVQGRLWYSLPLIGYVNTSLNGQSKSWIVPAVAGLLFAYAAYAILSSIVTSSRAKRRREHERRGGRPASPGRSG